MKQSGTLSNVNELNTAFIQQMQRPAVKKICTDNENNNLNNELLNTNNNNHRDFASIFDEQKEKKSMNITNNSNVNDNLYAHYFLNESIVDENYIEKINASTAQNLNIEIINSLIMPKGLIIKINALGMTENSLRNAFDGHTYFGYLNDLTNNNQIDFLVKQKEDIPTEDKLIGRHFRIKYNPDENVYSIKDFGCGYGTFMKILTQIQIKDSYLINLGNSYIVCTFGVEELDVDEQTINNPQNFLNIKVFSGNSKKEPYFFNPEQTNKIYIGRDVECDIIIDDNLLSRIHCTLEFIDDIWMITDGKNTDDGKNKPSTNGSWLYLIEETEIYNEMIFKSNQNVYKCTLSD